MKLYEIHESVLPADMKMTLSTLLNRSGFFDSRDEMVHYVKKNKISIRGRGLEIDSPAQPIRIKDNTVIKVDGKGSMRVRINGEDLARKRHQDGVNRDIDNMKRNL